MCDGIYLVVLFNEKKSLNMTSVIPVTTITVEMQKYKPAYYIWKHA